MKTNPNDCSTGYGFTSANGESHINETGLTKREYFAAMAMQGLLSSVNPNDFESISLTQASVRISDELIKFLNK